MSDQPNALQNLLQALSGVLPKPPLQQVYEKTREIMSIVATPIEVPSEVPEEYHELTKAESKKVHLLCDEIISQLAEASLVMYEHLSKDLLGEAMASKVQQELAIHQLRQKVTPEEFKMLMESAAKDFEKATGESAESIRRHLDK